MDRRTWLTERRHAAEAQYDTRYAPTYDAEDTPMTLEHRPFVQRVVDAAPAGGTILDAPCGTGKYFGLILSAGRHVTGADQSAGMLAQAHAKHSSARLEKVGLQELAFDTQFDGVICVDAIENIPPEEWPAVLANLRRALRPEGLLYLTVEEIDRDVVDAAYARALAEGLPVEPGEHTIRGGGYHFYPTRPQVRGWLDEAALAIVEETSAWAGSYGYWHLLLRPSLAMAEQQ